ncbi:MAG: replication initiator protein A [Deltaproteobacteria bacterium]|nr:replication initiator protein A [Deltaproteobacteria bacterium]
MQAQVNQTEYPVTSNAKMLHGYSMRGSAVSRDEMNLAEFPLAVLSTRTNPSVKTLEFSDSVKLSSGEIINRQWVITGADKFGLPTSTDDDVILGLMRLTKEQNFHERKVYFTRYELLKILRWTTEGRSYSRLTKSLDRLSGLRIKASNAFYDNSLKAYQTKNFGIIDAYEINDERGGNSTKNPNSYFIWSELMFDSFKSGFIKKIDLEFYFSLKSAVSRRLYRYLDKHFYYSRTLEKPLMVLVFEKLGLSRTYQYVSSIKQQLMPACDELIAKGFLASVDFEGRGEGTIVKFTKAGTQTAVLPDYSSTAADVWKNKVVEVKSEVQSEGPNTTLFDQVASALVKRGLSSGQVKHLLAEKDLGSLERISKIISYYDELVETNNAKISRNPIGFLYRAVERPTEFKLPTTESIVAIRSKRPELKLMSQKKTSEEKNRKTRLLYENYVNQEYHKLVSTFSSEAVAIVRSKVENKISCLKQVLGADKYKQAFNGMVKSELLSSASILSFEEWVDRENLA